VSQQDASGSWDVGDLQMTAYVSLGLGAVGGTGTTAAIESAVEFFLANRLTNHGFPFSVTSSGIGPEYTIVDSEVIRAIDVLWGTPAGAAVVVSPSQLATVTFTDVSVPGSTTVVAQQASGELPYGYKLVEGFTYDVQTSAVVSGSTTVCFGAALTNGISDVRILHLENGQWVDRTSSTNCASADSLDAFAIGQLDPNATDTEAPRLSVTLSPAVLSPANNKMIAIAAAIGVSDNADPAPSITLVSITATGDNTGNRKDDVEGAAIGTDDRAFSVRAEKGRSYTIVYRATDRSGNAAEISTTVSVK